MAIENNNVMKSRILINIAFTLTLLGVLPQLDGIYRILMYLVIAILALSVLIMLLQNSFKGNFWSRILDISTNVQIIYLAIGFSAIVNGARLALADTDWRPLGFLLLFFGILIYVWDLSGKLGKFICSLFSRTNRPTIEEIAGAWQKRSFAGLEVIAYPSGKRGLYFTDEFIEVTFELTNITTKRLKGSALFFYGFGASGLEGNTSELVPFDLQPKGMPGDKKSVTALNRLIGVQGNCIVGWLLPQIDKDVIEETREEITLKSASKSSRFETLYTFISYNREFYNRVYNQQESLMRSTRNLTRWVISVAVVTLLAILIQILISLNIICSKTS